MLRFQDQQPTTTEMSSVVCSAVITVAKKHTFLNKPTKPRMIRTYTPVVLVVCDHSK